MVQNLHKLREEIALGMDRGHCFRTMFAECRTRKSFKKLSIEARIGKYGIDFVVVTQRTEWSLKDWSLLEEIRWPDSGWPRLAAFEVTLEYKMTK